MREEARTRAAVHELTVALGRGPWRLSDLRGAGWTDRQVRRAVDAGRLVRPHRGVVSLPEPSATDLVRAALLTVGRTAVASHGSGGLIHGLWLPAGATSLVHLTIPGSAERTDHGVRIHGSRLSEEHVVTVDGIRTTSLARTALDVARGRPLPDAMMVVDSAARAIVRQESGRDLRFLRSPQERAGATDTASAALQHAFGEMWTWPGSVVARAAIELVDPAAESPLESTSRGWFHEARLPRPTTAYQVQGASGTWYVADFAWVERRVLGEADGLGKYGTEPAAVARALRAERLRQRDLEDAGWVVVRWDSQEPRRSVVRRLARALGQAQRGASLPDVTARAAARGQFRQ
jgi:hypothetical protein